MTMPTKLPLPAPANALQEAVTTLYGMTLMRYAQMRRSNARPELHKMRDAHRNLIELMEYCYPHETKKALDLATENENTRLKNEGPCPFDIAGASRVPRASGRPFGLRPFETHRKT